MQHAWKHVERPGGSHTALDGKKDPVVEILTKQLGSEMLVKSESASLKELVNQVRSAPYYRTGL